MQAETRECLTCGKPVKGRSDKKFCDDYCRNSYNNQMKRMNHQPVSAINTVVRKNRAILEKLMGAAPSTPRVSREQLLREGFHFKYITHSHTNKKGGTYYYCYEYGYLPVENERYLIVKQPE